MKRKDWLMLAVIIGYITFMFYMIKSINEETCINLQCVTNTSGKIS